MSKLTKLQNIYAKFSNKAKHLLVWSCVLLGINVWAQPTSTLANLAPINGNLPLPKVESKLPSCQGQTPRQWNMCFGSFTFPNGNSYVGEWRNSQRDGVGTLRIVSGGPTSNNNIGTRQPSTYIGEFREGRLHGHGVWVVDNGERYEGEFAMNVLVRINRADTVTFGSDMEKFKKKCEAYGLKFGTGEFAQCMLSQERMANEAMENSANRAILNREAERRANAESTNNAINAFKAMGEISRPQWLSNPNCPSVLNAPPGQYPGCN